LRANKEADLLIKSADDKSRRLALLEELQRSPLLDRRQQEWLRDELHRTRRGIAGERDAAHYLDNYLKDDPHRALLHDLRFSVDGDVVQIDHMIIARSMFVYLLETKNFNGNLRINEFGEFSVEYAGERVFGIPSPMEQSRRHEGPLRKLFDALGIHGRNGGAAQVHHCVLVNPGSIIHRPSAKKLDTSNVIKADQFRAWHERLQEQAGVGSVFGSILNIRGAETIKEFAQKLLRQHRPADLLALPDFMKPRTPDKLASVGAPRLAPVAVELAESNAKASKTAASRKLVCATCGAKITFAEGKYCWNNESRFGGLQYCREHQSALR
jgi:Nuclease-related domain